MDCMNYLFSESELSDLEKNKVKKIIEFVKKTGKNAINGGKNKILFYCEIQKTKLLIGINKKTKKIFYSKKSLPINNFNNESDQYLRNIIKLFSSPNKVIKYWKR